MYYKIFSKKFNFHFKPPNKDNCRLCDGLEIKICAADEIEKKALMTEKKFHIWKAEQARSALY